MVKSSTNKPKLTALDLFCGCGGLTLGLKNAGFKVLGAIDIEPAALSVYEANHSEVFTWKRDIRELTTTEVMGQLKLQPGDLTLLAGCPPCQGFSTMRTLNGGKEVEDERNDLLFDFLRFVVDLKPKAVMLENVPGLKDDSRFETFYAEMQELGYQGEPQILNAGDYGVPQRRRRFIYIAGLGFDIPYAPEADHKPTVRDAIEDLPPAGSSGDYAHDLPEKRTRKVMERILGVPHDGGSRDALPPGLELDCHKNTSGFKDVYGRMAWDKQSPTITSGCFNPSKGRFLHPVENRAITVREAALLQGFPPRYKFCNSLGKIALSLMIGNALPPPFIFQHANSIYDSLTQWDHVYE